jgi:hypothetical protein
LAFQERPWILLLAQQICIEGNYAGHGDPVVEKAVQALALAQLSVQWAQALVNEL